MKQTIKLSLSDIDVIRDETEDDGNIDFSIARLKFMGTSVDDTENSQGYLLSEEVLKKYANTALGKLITGKVNPYSKDMMSHEETPNIFGYIPPNSEITFIQEEKRWFAICEAVISKIYCKDVIDAFRLDNDRCVSIEASIESNPNNPKLIESFLIHSITILSKVIRGAVKGANMEIIKFSSEKAEEYYNHKEENPLKKFAEDRKKKMDDNKLISHKLDKTEYVESDWNGEKAKHDSIKEKNFDTIAKSIFLKLDADYKERKIGSLHYPVMGLYGGVWKYNAEGLGSARAYGEQHDPSVADKAIAIQKKLGLYKDTNKEENMTDNKDVKLADEEKVELAEDKEKDIIMGSDEEKSEETVGEGCDSSAKMAETEPEKQLDTVNKDPQDKKVQKEEAKAQWSAENVEQLIGDSLAKDVVMALFSGDSIESLVSNLVAFAEEKEELKKEKEKADKEKADVKFSQIMAMAKLKLDNGKYDEMFKKGETLKFSELDSFEKDVKACICDTVVFADVAEINPTVSFGTHMTLTETNSNSLWN